MSKSMRLSCIVLLTAVINFLALPVLAQLEVPQVPPTLRFGDMTLHLTEQAQRDIQTDVDALYRSPKYFYMKLERVDMYLPIIEPILAAHGVPDEVKYLVIQESALISDAVSSSNAVGFWQFKEASATEVGLRVDRQVDERMNIVSSTTGAAKYLLRSNATFDNWLYSLQSYQMGLGGASRALDKRYYGAKELKIDSDTYWYVKKFLSHLVAFRDAVGKQPRSLMLYQHKGGANKSLDDIAQEFDTDPVQLTEYNKWLKSNKVPDDKEYVVIVPVVLEEAPNLLAESSPEVQKKNKKQSLEDRIFGEKQKVPEVPAAERDKLAVTEVNGIRAVVARAGDTSRDLAKVGGVSVSDFLKFNEINPGDVLKAGQVYYFRKKKRKASVYRHVVAEGESLWDVSQKYGIRLKKLLQKNRMEERDGVKPGQVLWLRHIRPADEPVAFEAVPAKTDEAKVAPAPAAMQDKPKVVKGAAPVEKRESVKENLPQPVVPQQLAQQQQQVVASTQPVAYPQYQAKQQQQQVPQQARQVESPSQPAIAAPEIVVVVDTPLITPVATAVPQQSSAAVEVELKELPVQERTASDTIVRHLYPDSQSDKRNVYPQNGENGFNAAPQRLAVKKEADPDSFAVTGPVSFIGEEEVTVVQQQEASKTKAEPVPLQEQPAVLPVQQATVLQSQLRDSVHVVQAGETLYGISRKWGLSVQELRDRNNMGADAVLSIGQELRISKPQMQQSSPAMAQVVHQAEAGTATAQLPATANEPYTRHTVAEGETMYRVARKYNVTIKDIMEWNKKDDFSIHPGEVLIVGKK